MTKSWTLGDAANLAEIVGAIAIVISLIYVGKELKSNTAAVQAASLQSISNATSAGILATVGDEQLADLRFRGLRDFSQLTDVEQYRFYLYERQQWLHYQNVWTQWRLGTIDDGVWQGYEHNLCSNLRILNQKDSWRDLHATALSKTFVDLVDACGAVDYPKSVFD